MFRASSSSPRPHFVASGSLTPNLKETWGPGNSQEDESQFPLSGENWPRSLPETPKLEKLPPAEPIPSEPEADAFTLPTMMEPEEPRQRPRRQALEQAKRAIHIQYRDPFHVKQLGFNPFGDQSRTGLPRVSHEAEKRRAPRNTDTNGTLLWDDEDEDSTFSGLSSDSSIENRDDLHVIAGTDSSNSQRYSGERRSTPILMTRPDLMPYDSDNDLLEEGIDELRPPTPRILQVKNKEWLVMAPEKPDQSKDDHRPRDPKSKKVSSKHPPAKSSKKEKPGTQQKILAETSTVSMKHEIADSVADELPKPSRKRKKRSDSDFDWKSYMKAYIRLLDRSLDVDNDIIRIARRSMVRESKTKSRLAGNSTHKHSVKPKKKIIVLRASPNDRLVITRQLRKIGNLQKKVDPKIVSALVSEGRSPPAKKPSKGSQIHGVVQKIRRRKAKKSRATELNKSVFRERDASNFKVADSYAQNRQVSKSATRKSIAATDVSWESPEVFQQVSVRQLNEFRENFNSYSRKITSSKKGASSVARKPSKPVRNVQIPITNMFSVVQDRRDEKLEPVYDATQLLDLSLVYVPFPSLRNILMAFECANSVGIPVLDVSDGLLQLWHTTNAILGHVGSAVKVDRYLCTTENLIIFASFFAVWEEHDDGGLDRSAFMCEISRIRNVVHSFVNPKNESGLQKLNEQMECERTEQMNPMTILPSLIHHTITVSCNALWWYQDHQIVEKSCIVDHMKAAMRALIWYSSTFFALEVNYLSSSEIWQKTYSVYIDLWKLLLRLEHFLGSDYFSLDAIFSCMYEEFPNSEQWMNSLWMSHLCMWSIRDAPISYGTHLASLMKFTLNYLIPIQSFDQLNKLVLACLDRCYSIVTHHQLATDDDRIAFLTDLLSVVKRCTGSTLDFVSSHDSSYYIDEAWQPLSNPRNFIAVFNSIVNCVSEGAGSTFSKKMIAKFLPLLLPKQPYVFNHVAQKKDSLLAFDDGTPILHFSLLLHTLVILSRISPPNQRIKMLNYADRIFDMKQSESISAKGMYLEFIWQLIANVQSEQSSLVKLVDLVTAETFSMVQSLHKQDIIRVNDGQKLNLSPATSPITPEKVIIQGLQHISSFFKPTSSPTNVAFLRFEWCSLVFRSNLSQIVKVKAVEMIRQVIESWILRQSILKSCSGTVHVDDDDDEFDKYFPELDLALAGSSGVHLEQQDQNQSDAVATALADILPYFGELMQNSMRLICNQGIDSSRTEELQLFTNASAELATVLVCHGKKSWNNVLSSLGPDCYWATAGQWRTHPANRYRNLIFVSRLMEIDPHIIELQFEMIFNTWIQGHVDHLLCDRLFKNFADFQTKLTQCLLRSNVTPRFVLNLKPQWDESSSLLIDSTHRISVKSYQESSLRLQLLEDLFQSMKNEFILVSAAGNIQTTNSRKREFLNYLHKVPSILKVGLNENEQGCKSWQMYRRFSLQVLGLLVDFCFDFIYEPGQQSSILSDIDSFFKNDMHSDEIRLLSRFIRGLSQTNVYSDPYLQKMLSTKILGAFNGMVFSAQSSKSDREYVKCLLDAFRSSGSPASVYFQNYVIFHHLFWCMEQDDAPTLSLAASFLLNDMLPLRHVSDLFMYFTHLRMWKHMIARIMNCQLIYAILDSVVLKLVNRVSPFCHYSPDIWSSIIYFVVEHTNHVVIHCFNSECADDLPSFSRHLPEYDNLRKYYSCAMELVEEAERTFAFENSTTFTEISLLTSAYENISSTLYQMTVNQRSQSAELNFRFNHAQVLESIIIQISQLWFFLLTDDKTPTDQVRLLRSYSADILKWSSDHSSHWLANVFSKYLLDPLGYIPLMRDVPLLCTENL